MPAARFPVFRVPRDMGGNLKSCKQLTHLPHPGWADFQFFSFTAPLPRRPGKLDPARRPAMRFNGLRRDRHGVELGENLKF